MATEDILNDMILFVYLFLYSQNMEYVWQQKIY